MTTEVNKYKLLAEKWVGEDDKLNLKPIAEQSTSRYRTTLQMLENQQRQLKEDLNVTSQISNYDPVVINMVRRITPQLIAYDICGVQPMSTPTGLGFAIKARYPNASTPYFDANSKEALYDKVDTAHAGTGTHDDTLNPFDDVDVLAGTGVGMEKTVGETAKWKSMGITIEKIALEAKTRQLRADYSLEIENDMRAVHGLDASAELANILTNEIVLEQNQELVRTLYHCAMIGAQGTATAGTFNYSTETDGRWAGERALGLWAFIQSEANKLFLKNRRGAGNFIITSLGVANALIFAGILKSDTNLDTKININLTSNTYVGTAGRFKVFVDPFLTHNGVLIGYKGANELDAGMIFAPYVPLTAHRGIDVQNDFKPAIGFQTRYAVAPNPFTTLEKGKNVYYTKFKVDNLPF